MNTTTDLSCLPDCHRFFTREQCKNECYHCADAPNSPEAIKNYIIIGSVAVGCFALIALSCSKTFYSLYRGTKKSDLPIPLLTKNRQIHFDTSEKMNYEPSVCKKLMEVALCIAATFLVIIGFSVVLSLRSSWVDPCCIEACENLYS